MGLGLWFSEISMKREAVCSTVRGRRCNALSEDASRTLRPISTHTKNSPEE